MGRTIAAGVPIAKGELVVSERPLLSVPPLRVLPRELRRLLRGGAKELKAPIGHFLNLYAYTNADDNVRRQVLTFCSYEVYTPTLPTNLPLDNDAPPLPRIINTAMRVSAWWNAQPVLAPRRGGAQSDLVAEISIEFSIEELTRVQCCFLLNAHEILEDVTAGSLSATAESLGLRYGVPEPEPEPEPRPEADPLLEPKSGANSSCRDTEKCSDIGKPASGTGAAGGTHALFLTGSRLTHVCGGPNTVYHYQNGYGCHRALRDISVGEMLTSCYLGARTACGRKMRRQHLRVNYLFDCGCTTCSSGRDWYRLLPCPHCGESRDSHTGLLTSELSRLESSSPSSRINFTESFQVITGTRGCETHGWVCRDVGFSEPNDVANGSPASTTCSSDCWQCCSCGRTFTDSEIDCAMTGPAPLPLRLSGPGTLFEWENRCDVCE